jgi:hypothetical protein
MKKNKEKRKFNYFKFVWVMGIFAILVFILVIVMKYKIYYEKMVGYLYFYNCSESLCYSTKKEDTESKTIYSKYNYDGKIPNVLVLENNLVVINGNILYNYVTGNIITEEYDSYRSAGSNIIVSKNNKYGSIDNEGNVLIELNYDSITSTDGIYYVVKNEEDEFYRLIDNDSNTILEDYSYIYEFNNVIVVVKDMKLTIQDMDGNLLVNKELDVYDKEELVSVSNDNNILYIKIYKEGKYYLYSYDIENKKLDS